MASSEFRRIAKCILLASVTVPLVVIWPVERVSWAIKRCLEAGRSRWRELNEDQKFVCTLDESIRGYRRDIAACFACACASSKPEEVEHHLKTAWQYVGNYAAVLQTSAVITGRHYEDRNDIC
jgi:hypothetical protein